MDKKEITKFQKLIWNFYKHNKRTFPWRETQDPYQILVSEIMLQQTQADRVVRYYERFLQKFPTAAKLAKANFKDIYELWQGLGYNRRGLALQKAAQGVSKNGWPADLETLPGVGPYTARAVNIFSFNAPVACIETNIRRVFIHHFFKDKEGITDEDILKIAEQVLPKRKSREWHWALMDYGSHLKSLPDGRQANRKHKQYAVQSKFEGSVRQMRGNVLRLLSAGPQKMSQLKSSKSVLDALGKEGFIKYNAKNKTYSLA